MQTLVSEANEANAREREMKLWTAFKVYPKAIFWSVVLSSSLIMEGCVSPPRSNGVCPDV